MLILALLLGAAGANGTAQCVQPQGGPCTVDEVVYAPDAAVTMRLAPGSQTSVHFAPGEIVSDYDLGDTQGWRVVAFDAPQMLVRAVRPAGSTSLRVRTNARAYQFTLTSIADPTLNTPRTVRFAEQQAVAAPAPALAASAAPRPRSSATYKLTGDRLLHPAGLWDDGQHTYVEWRPEQELPAVFAIDGRQEVLVNGHMRDGRYVIDLVYPSLIFRLGGDEARARRSQERRR